MDLIKRSFIGKVTEDLRILNGSEFEYFCRPILRLLVNDDVIHKGHNLFAKPVSKTADFSTHNFSVVGQCGTDNNYFEVFSKSFDDLLKLKLEISKPIKDIISAIKNSDQCETIYLFANQVASGGKLDGVNKVIAHFDYKKEIFVYDSQLIAEIIYENIPNQRFISKLIDFLPSAYQLYLSISKNNELPALQGDIIEREEETSLIKHLEIENLLQIHGISGIGKTKITLSVAHKLRSSFDIVIWVNGESNENLDFKSIKINEFDKNLNLENLCSCFSALLIVDNFNGDSNDVVNKFVSFSKKNSKLIITSLHKTLNDQYAYHLGEMAPDDALVMLCHNNTIEIELASRILKKVGGYPLGIKLISEIISNEKFSPDEIDDFIGELDKLPEEFVPEKSKTIAELIIGKYSGIFKLEFTIISLLNSLNISNFAIKKVLGLFSLRNLTNSSLIMRDNLLVSSIHSIILMAIKNLETNKLYENEVIDLICKAVEQENENKSVEYFNFCILHNDFLQSLYANNALNSHFRKILLYAIIQTTDNIAFKEELVSGIEQFNLNDNDEINIYLQIEKIELSLISVDKKKDNEKYLSIANSGILVLQALLKDNKSKNLDLLIKHHIAKITYWKGEDAAAAIAFSELLLEYPESQHSRLQLARILSNQKKYEQVDEQIEIALGSENKVVSHAILLSFYDLLADSNLHEARKKFIDDRIVDFLVDISSTLHASFDHPYRVISKLSSHLGFNHPIEFSALCSNLPAPDNAEKNTKVMQAYASIQMALYRVYKYSELDDKEKLMESASSLAEKYYLESGVNTDFQKRDIAKFYLEIERYDQAMNALESYENKNDPFYFQTLSKTQRGLKDIGSALASIDQAIEIEKENGCRKWFLSSFYNDKAEALYVNNDPDAISNLEEAIGLQSTPKTQKAWLSKLDKWKEELNC